ncbi:uncharacterized protein LOC122400280 [Colletes gigas]|uniref:uncharacterized protein LOC122400280 n=1 Tax=Colletes gigas TaxID=935657 RepID=UPI001C9BBBD0|nr:uncharacterized protein LOC122400280 [Colletes gigas]XP_043257585.1 uncharacterized protein LOC122400280 [Colletes gigas]
MRERTPSADDTPKRAPPAPPREAASADVAGSKTSSEAVDVFRATNFSPTTTASATTAATTTSASSPSSVEGKMVASTHNLDDLGVSHPASANGDRQQQQEKHGNAYRSAQTAQDKRSRLSNVINNLRKKVPDARTADSPRKEEDERNSVERNLETLEKYVMTVLNGVIKEEVDIEEDIIIKTETETANDSEKLTDDQEDEDSKGPAANFEPSKPNESRTETAVLSEQSGTKETFSLELIKVDKEEDEVEVIEISDRDTSETDTAGEGEEETDTADETEAGDESLLGQIIMARLNDRHEERRIDKHREFMAENAELRNVCRDLLNDLLNDITQLIDGNGQERDKTKVADNLTETCTGRSQDLATTSLHCSLPLDKVASVLQNCQPVEIRRSSSTSSCSSHGSLNSCKPSPPTVRHLCLYCDRKFLSISLRQRHTERVHQQGGGRRSERNSRRPTHNCQYCSNKCAENLEGLFQHMASHHSDRYHACVQCSTRYLTRDALAVHMSEVHGIVVRNNQPAPVSWKDRWCSSLSLSKLLKKRVPKVYRSSLPQEKTNSFLYRELTSQRRDRIESSSSKEKRPEEDHEHRTTEPILLKPILQTKETFSNPGSPEFDSSFYSSVSCNIRDNLLHHLDGKLQSTSSATIVSSAAASTADPKPQQQQQSFYEHNANQIQFPIDISLTAATPVYSKEYATEEYENSSEYAQKPGKSNRSHPRRVSFEKYNFPRKYDGKEQWTCSIKDLSKFDISTQLSLRKKQQLLKERVTLNRLHQIPLIDLTGTTDVPGDERNASRMSDEPEIVEEVCTGRTNTETDRPFRGDAKPTEIERPFRADAKPTEREPDVSELKKITQDTEFTVEFGSFLRLRKWDEKTSNEAAKKQEVVYAELTGEWSRPRIYVCGACATKHVTLREMEEHKAATHPNVWCSHFEFSGDQRELYKHLFLPGKDVPTAKAKAAILAEKVCTKCTRNCNTLPELHRHMLECGGDQAWLLGLFGNGKKKCKWRPFGSRSRRRRQRGMKRNIQNSQTPRVNTPKEKQPPGPRVRPSDRESIQKMLANLPPKRATRKVMQDSALRAQGRLRNVQTRSRPGRMVGDNSTASRMSRNKAVLRNKLLKNAKSIQRNRCRIDNISAVIESVVRNYKTEEARSDGEKRESEKSNVAKDAKEKTEENGRLEEGNPGYKARVARGPRVLSKKRNVRPKEGAIRNVEQPRKTGNLKAKAKATSKTAPETKADVSNEAPRTPKSLKLVPKTVEKESDASSSAELKSPGSSTKNKSFLQTTPKKKRPVDPVASLNASIKAKSQLRTHDGKFARNPNKATTPQKSPEMRSPVGQRQWAKGKVSEIGTELSSARSKLRGLARGRNSDQLPKRTTRLSSDSDKMPTLEPAVQAQGDEYVETLVNDLPILSPVTPSTGSEKILRGKSLFGKSQDVGSKKTIEVDGTEAKLATASDTPDEDKEQKPGKTRRAKSDAKNLENIVAKEKTKGGKEKIKRKSAPASIATVEEASPRKEKQKKEEVVKTLETRSNSKLKGKMIDIDGKINIQSVPFEVKKLLGSDLKDDLLTKLVLTSRIAASKRCLRQATKAKMGPGRGRPPKDFEVETASADSESASYVPAATTKKEKIDRRRKSLRNTEKRIEKVPSLDEANKIKVAIKGRRNSSSSGESKSTEEQTSEEDDQTKSTVEITEQSGDNENTSNKRQTRGSLLNSNEGDTQSKETSSELNDMSLKKNTSLGKRRGRIKSSNDTSDKKNADVSRRKNEEVDKGNSNEVVDKAGESETNSDRKRTPDDDNGVKDGKEEDANVAKNDQPEDSLENVNLKNHLQLETSNSIDSGKENSLETIVGVQKSKVGRPRKSWGTRRERTSKRSLNNVIGILTEGMNIPAESQQSVVLTVQTTLENATPEGVPQSNAQQSDDGETRSLSLDRTDKTETTNDSDRLADETKPCVQNPEDKLSKPQTTEVSAKDATAEDSLTKKNVDSSSNDARERSPTNDIILDLSRRKQKGKGSFLEKIVSKIAKQKDALLEGEVGSLLDTAADELTSILDEVSPGLPENAENSKLAKKSHVAREEIEKSSDCQDLSLGSDQNLESKVPAIESEQKKEEPSKEIINDDGQISSSGQQVEVESVNEDGNNCSKDERTEDLAIRENVPLEPDSGSVVESTPNRTEETRSPDQEDKSVKQDGGAAIEDAKVKRKSKKRSLEGNSPKKSKRKSIEPEDNSETLVPEALNLSDIMKLIDRSKEVHSTKEIIENGSSSEVVGERVQPGKRKTLNDESETKDLLNDKATKDTQTNTDCTDGAKKRKTDATRDEANESRTAKNSIEDSMKISDEEKDSFLSRVTGKRETIIETANEDLETESLIRRISKRKSLSEEKSQPSEEESSSKVESVANEATPETTRRRRSSRTKFNIQKEEKVQKEVESSNEIIADKLLTNDSPEIRESFKDDASLLQSTCTAKDDADKVEETAVSNDPETPKASKEDAAKDVPETDSKWPLKDAKTVSKTFKKRNRRKKSLATEATNAIPREDPDSKPEMQTVEIETDAAEQVSNRKSLRSNRFNEEAEQTKAPSDSMDSLTPSLEHFKIPEVTEVLQLTKKRTYKRKSTTDEHTEVVPPVESETESSETRRISVEKDEQSDNASQKDSSEGRRRSSRNFNKDQLDLERSNSSGSIELAQSSRTRSSRRKQLSSEDLSNQETLNHRAESVDNLSETSCASESSYFRKKRFSKKKKGFEVPAEDVQTDTSVTDSESVDAEKNTDRRQSLKRRAKKNISFFEYQFDLVDDFDIPLDIQECLRQDDPPKDVDLEQKLIVEDKAEDKKIVDEASKVEGEENAIVEQVAEGDAAKENVAEESTMERNATEESTMEENATEESTIEENATEENAIEGNATEDPDTSIEENDEEDSKEDEKSGGAQVQDDFQTPKKRAAGNFVVVHKKTGEILIVEKRKKLTKEAARFFCDVCTTSFTRKSSLKKHNLSQSHLVQMTKSKKDKTSDDSTEEGCNIGWDNETSSHNETSNDGNKSPDESASVSQESKDDRKEEDLTILDSSRELEGVQGDSCYAASIEQGFLIDAQVTRQRSLEDELLDEEICKITENMSHDEYVLTEHSSPAPESTSTPIKPVVKKTEETVKKKKHAKRKEKGKKKYAVNEHLTLDTPEPETHLDSTVLTVLGTSMSIRISTASRSKDTSETLPTATAALENNSLLADSSNHSEQRNASVPEADNFQERITSISDRHDQNSDMEVEVAVKQTEEVSYSVKEVIELKGDPNKKTENLSSVSDDKVAVKETPPHERLSLKFIINKRSIERSKEPDIESVREVKDVVRGSDAKFESFDSVGDRCNQQREEETNRCKLKSDRSDEDSKGRDTDDVENLKTQQTDRCVVENFEKETHQLDGGTEAESKMADSVSPRNASTRTTRHGKSKKGKTKKRLEEAKSPSSSRKASKSKGNQNWQVLDEIVKLPETENNQTSTNCSETFDCEIAKPESPSSNSRFGNDSDKVDDSTSLGKPENETERDPDELEIVENQQTYCSDAKASLKETVDAQRVEIGKDENEEDHREDKIESLYPLEVDEASSSSSLAYKPLSQVLSRTDEKEQEASLSFMKDRDESKLEERAEIEDANSRTKFNLDENSRNMDESMDNQKSDKESNDNDVKRVESRIASEEECELDGLKTAEDSDEDAKISSDYKKDETTPKSKAILENRETKTVSSGRKSSNNDRQSLNKKTRTHKYAGKDGHRRSRSRKAALRSKMADLTSDSDSSENEDKMESQNKNKIVKSVFGRVFGGEKADKVKEVLNDWVSKSEEDSNMSRTEYKSDNSLDPKNEDRNVKRHSVSSTASSSTRKRSGKKSRKNSSTDRTRERNSMTESLEEHRSGKHSKSKNGTNNRKKSDVEATNYYFLVLPPTSCRPSKKRAEERISKAFEDELSESNVGKDQKLSKQKEVNYELRNQGKSDSSVKDNGYGSFSCDKDSSKGTSEEPVEEDHKLTKRRKSSFRKGKSKNEDEDWRDLMMSEKETEKNANVSGDEDDCFMKDLPERETTDNPLLVDLESSRSCSSAAPSSVRNRSPSPDRNSQTTRNSSDFDDDDRDEMRMDHRRISPLFICGTPRSSMDSSSESENEEEDENAPASETAARKRSSSEFSGEKIVIRSPASTHKTEMVTIAPTDAIEDNALDVPQEIETAKPRQGKVLNFDEELFVECCSRLKATTENELRGAKKIKLDHNEGYHRKDEQQQGFRGPRDRWRDVESQNSLGSLLESVNQLLGEEMYSTRERDYPKRGGRNLRSEHSSRSASPDMSRADNLGYEDSLDVAFEHNNKLRDKIQQRMRESESLIASTFGQKSSNEIAGDERPVKSNEQDATRNSYGHPQDQGHPSGGNLSNGGYNDDLHVRSLQEQPNAGKMNLDSSGFKSKMNSALGGLLDKALSNLLHSNGKHDHNGSTPMKVLAELACARAPTSTAGDPASQDDVEPAKASSLHKDSTRDPSPIIVSKEQQKKIKNPIKELFEKKKEMNERKQQEKSKSEAALRELNVHRQRKTKKTKKHQEFPLIRRSEHGGLVERKKRRDTFERKEEFASNRIKDVYDFDEEESQMEPNLGSVMSYRSRPGYEVSCLRSKEVDVAGLMTKAIGESLENGKTGEALSTRLESMIDRKFKELEKFAPKTKGALKSFQSEEQQRQITGPMDDYIERKQSRPKRQMEPNLKHSKLKKRSKNPKKRPRNAWYENDSSDEYRIAVKTEGVGVGISKSQRTCSKGKQNIFAELYTSSESEFDGEDADYEAKRQLKASKCTKETAELESVEQSQEPDSKYCSENDDRVDDWEDHDSKNDVNKNDCDNKKSESEMSDQPLVIDERKDMDDQRNTDEETENQYEGNFSLDDLYREDSSIADTDIEEPTITESQNIADECRVHSPVLSQERDDGNKTDFMQDDELIPLEEALDLLDQAENDLGMKYDGMNKDARPMEDIDTVVTTEFMSETFDPIEESIEKCPSRVEEQEEEEQDDDLLALPEKLSTNEKPQKESDNLPLHVFLSRKVQESKKRKEQQLRKMQEEQERILMDFQPTRRQRKCAIGKQGLLAEISSSDEEISLKDSRKTNEKPDHEKPRKQKRESKEKRKERYIEKKHEQMIAKEQKAIEEEILRELGKKKESLAQNSVDPQMDYNGIEEPENTELFDEKTVQEQTPKKKHQAKEKQKKPNKTEEDVCVKKNNEGTSDLEIDSNKSTHPETNHETENNQEPSVKQKKHSKSPTKSKKNPKGDAKVSTASKKCKNPMVDKPKNRTDSKGSRDKERRSSSGRRDSDDEELKTTKSWNKVEEGVGVAIGRRKRAAANQLYYWSSSSDEEEMLEVVPAIEEEEDDRQEQHGWIVGDSHKRMITMLAMEKQLKEKRRRSEDEFEPGKAKSKKHRNSTS